MKLAGGGGVDLPEALEDPPEILLGNADAGVLDREIQPVVGDVQGDVDVATGGGELDRVNDKVQHHLVELVAVEEDPRMGGVTCPEQRDVVILGDVPQGFHQALEVRLDRCRLEIEVRVAGIEADEIEEVVNQFHQAQAVLTQQPDHFVDLWIFFPGLAHQAEAFCDPQHDGEGGSEFVADVGEEAGFCFVKLAEPLELRAQCFPGFFNLRPQDEFS